MYGQLLEARRVWNREKSAPGATPALWLGLPPTSSFTVKVMSTPQLPRLVSSREPRTQLHTALGTAPRARREIRNSQTVSPVMNFRARKNDSIS